MNKELGVWTYKDCALVLIDYQKEMFQTIRSETSAALAEINVRLLARTAKALDMPIVLSTVGVAYKINSPTVPGIVGELPDLEPIDRTSMNAFEDRLFRDWTSPMADKARQVINWYFAEVPKVTSDVGV